MVLVEIKPAAPGMKYNVQRDCIEVIAILDTGERKLITVCTAAYLVDFFEENNMNYLPPVGKVVIVKSITDEYIFGAIDEYVKQGYWEELVVME